jgi:hypothetical protein
MLLLAEPMTALFWSGNSAIFSNTAANSSTLAGLKENPFTPSWSNSSAAPTFLLDRIGNPLAIASLITSPQG